MESKGLLRDLDRAAAQPFIDYPRLPWWYPVFMGSYWAAITAGGLLALNGNSIAALSLMFFAPLSFGVFLGWYRSKWGTWPRSKGAPAETRRARRFWYVGVSAAVMLTAVVGLFGPPVVTVAVAFALFAAVVWVFEFKIYPSAVAQVRARLA